MTRLYTQNNVIILIRGPTGAGKSWSALKICQLVDPNFSAERIVFKAREFMRKWRDVPKRGFLLWDEPGVFLGHRKWLSTENQAVMEIMQSFRYRHVNVVMAVPSESYIDKVVRELIHRIVELPERLHKDPPIQGTVLRLGNYHGYPVWMPQGMIDIYPPTKGLIHDYESLRKERIEAHYADIDKRLEHAEAKEQAKLQQPIVPEKTVEQYVEDAKAILPNILHTDWKYKLAQGIERDVINMHELKKAFDIPHTKAYAVRQELLKLLREDPPRG